MEEMILKVSFCSKAWFDKHQADISIISDTEKEKLANITRGVPCIVAVDEYPTIDMYAVIPNNSGEISLSDDIYANAVEMASLLNDIDGISNEVEVSLNGFNVTGAIREAILEVLKLLIPKYTYTYKEGRESL